MPNDKDWERRSDQWVKAMHESRLKKAQEKNDRAQQKATKISQENEKN